MPAAPRKPPVVETGETDQLVLKQVASTIDRRTTMTCLDCAGQIRRTDEPFETLSGQFMTPPFHWNCRSMAMPWRPGFLDKMRTAANREIGKRPVSQKRKGPGGKPKGASPPPKGAEPRSRLAARGGAPPRTVKPEYVKSTYEYKHTYIPETARAESRLTRRMMDADRLWRGRVDFDGMPGQYSSEIADRLGVLLDRYPAAAEHIHDIKVLFAGKGISKSTWAAYDPASRDLIFNGNWYVKNPEGFANAVSRTLQTGFHPYGDTESVVVHEFGHVVDHLGGRVPVLGYSFEPIWGQDFPRLGVYATRNSAEQFAEAFAVAEQQGLAQLAEMTSPELADAMRAVQP